VDDPTARDMGGVAGDAGLFSTADDLSRFCQMMLDKGIAPSGVRIFSPSTIDLFTSPQSPPGEAAVRGLGWDIDSPFSGNRGELFPARGSYGHTGYTGTSLWLDPGSDTYVILLTNSVHPHATTRITALRKSVATAVAAAAGYSRNVSTSVLTGLDVLAAGHFAQLAGKRVGLITNQTGIDREGRRNIDVMRAAGVHLTALFSPEHGFLGTEDRENVEGTVDKATGIRVFSLYSTKNQRPTPEMLRDIDVMVFDIADAGARFYTYITTMAYAMETCAKAGKPFVVLDRPNPITGLHVEGPTLDMANKSFVGYFPMPLRHGMTVGELARMFNGENAIHADLTVVPMANWRRDEWFDQTGLIWVNPSPNMRTLTAALLYPAIGMLEYSTNYSVGRGTNEPFEIAGAAWIKGTELASYLNSRSIPGVRIYPVRFRPEGNHFAGVELDGVRFLVTNRDVLDTARLGLELACALRKLYPGQMHFEVNRLLIGASQAIAAIERGDDPQSILAAEERGSEKFRALRRQYLLYD
jgi:uncharacterized protein YbbC (DUF1343 family)